MNLSRTAPLAVSLGLIVSLAACGEDSATPAVAVSASDDACEVSVTALDAGPTTFTVSNDGESVTEFYLYAEGDRVLGEVENIDPGETRDLVVDLSSGSVEGACKPGMVGDGIRQTLTISGAAAQPLSDSAELKAAAKSYERYVSSQSEALIDKTTEFVEAVKAGEVNEAKRLFPIARTYWERIEPVAEVFGDLDPITDGREPDAIAEGVEFTGWHRIEKQLWVKNNTKGMTKYADQLLDNIQQVVTQAKDQPLTALQLAQGSKGLLDEVATGKITGEEDEFSHTDLWDFKANIEGSQAAIAALRPVLEDQAPDLVTELDERFAAVDQELDQHQAADGSWTFYDELSKQQIKALSDVVAALSEPISKVAAVVAASA